MMAFLSGLRYTDLNLATLYLLEIEAWGKVLGLGAKGHSSQSKFHRLKSGVGGMGKVLIGCAGPVMAWAFLTLRTSLYRSKLALKRSPPF
jgi:hypothetical protein